LASLERDRVPSARSIAAKEIPLIDRVEEMKLLKEAVDSTIQGEGGLVFLYGEAGIGKTRLARELGAYARLREMLVLYGKCPTLFRMSGVPPYILWREVIRDYLEKSRSEQLYRVIGLYPAEVAKLVPELGQRLATIPQSFPINPEREQNRLFEAVSQFITNISKETPLLVVLDDLQWADPSSLLLLHYLARGVHRTRLLLLGAYRSTDIDSKHPLTLVLTDLNRERLLQYAFLKRLSPSDISEMIKQILEQDDVSPEFCRMVYEKTRGNPFFAEEVIRSLKEEEVIYREENKWKIKEVSSVKFPETVKSVIEARISRLGDKYQHVLTMASLIGNDFAFEVLRGIIGIEEDKLRKIVDELLKTGLLKHRVFHGEDVCSFADIIVRDVVYEEVGTFERKKLHGIVGDALEKAYAERIDEHFGELASHFLESGDKDKALDYFMKAGEKAAKIYANIEAASYLQSAHKLIDEREGELEKRGAVLERLGDVKKLAGEYDACTRFWNEALPLWKRIDEKGKISRLHRKMAFVLWNEMGDTQKAQEHYDKALNILVNEPENAELASLYDEIARMSWRIGDPAKALSWAGKALELAKNLNADEVVANSYTNLGLILSSGGDVKKGLEYFEKALKIALDNGFMEIALRVYNNISLAALPSGEYERTLECYEKGFELAKKLGHIMMQSWIGQSLADLYVHMGNMDKALLLTQESVALDRKTGSLIHLSMSLNGLGRVYQILGEWDASEQYFKEALSISQKLSDFQAIAITFESLAYFHLAREEYGKAREFYEKACEVWEKAGAKIKCASCSHFSIWMSIELGETEKTENQIDSLRKLAQEFGDAELIAHTYRLRAMLFRTRKKWKESIEQFEKSLREFETIGAGRWDSYMLAKSVMFEYARAYLERDQEGDREKAHKLLSQALKIFKKMGAKKDIEKVEAKLLYIETGKEALVPKPTELVATGYADLDKLLCGGMRSSSAVVLTSPSCNERDSLIKSFLKTGAEKDEVTFYLTTSARGAKAFTEKPRPNSFLFVCNPQADAVAESSTNVFKLKGVESLAEISIALTSAIHKLDVSLKGPRRACIEIVSDVLLQHHAVQTRKWLTALTTELTSTGFTILAVVDPQMHPPEELHAILGLFDGEISIYEKGAEQFLKIKRMSDQKYLDDELLLKKGG
jgi:tetratricopeptide (TPR) repeat protein/KaiC/GvpD/RAD55 family RecA-like ATPase